MQDDSHLPDDLPVFPRSTRGRNCCAAELRPSFSIDPSAPLFGVRNTRQAHVSKLRAEVSVMALIHDERVLWDRRGVDVIRIQKINKLGLRASGLL